MELSFVTLDVFTKTRFEGNPLAVIFVPPSLKDKLTQAVRQKLAAEFNLSETVILHEVDQDDGNSAQRRIHIHTVDRELPFAGHPTIGTAFLLQNHFHLAIDTLVTNAGPIRLSSVDGHVRAKIPHNVHIHSKTLADIAHPAVEGGLSPVQPIRDAQLAAPVVSVVKGMTFVLVELPSLELLAQVRTVDVDFDHLPLPLLDSEWSPSAIMMYFYVRTSTSTEARTTATQSIRTRMIMMGTVEDPATGSAACTLASYLTLTEFQKGARFEITQGVEMGRKSDISVQTVAEEDGGQVKIGDMWLGGTAVVVSRGTISV